MTPTGTEAAEALLPFVISFVGSSGGGQYAFHLFCSVPKCRRRGTISASRHTVGSVRHKRKACGKLAAQGWRVEGSPFCPDCRRAGYGRPRAEAGPALPRQFP